MRFILRKSKSVFRFAILGLGLSLVSACVDHSDVPPGLSGIERYKIDAPSLDNLDDLDDLEEAQPLRKRVSRIEVVAPRAGDFITDITVRITQGPNVSVYQSHYTLKEDLEPVTREASRYLFEIDPGAAHYAKVSVTTEAATRLDKSSFCNPWVTAFTVNFKVAEVAADGSEVTSEHSGTEVESTCSSLFPLPFSSHIEDPLEEAFQQAVTNAIRERAAGTEPSLSAAGPKEVK